MRFVEMMPGMRVEISKDYDLMAETRLGLAPIVLVKGEKATVISVARKFGHMALLRFEREIPLPVEFGGPTQNLWVHDPDPCTGMQQIDALFRR